ncbi:hypothetical protein [Novosphingobium sp. BL-52-GroH]
MILLDGLKNNRGATCASGFALVAGVKTLLEFVCGVDWPRVASVNVV